MKRRRIFLIIFVFLILILVIGVGALLLMQGGFGGPAQEPTPAVSAETEPTAVPETPTQPVVVVIQPVRRGQRIPPDAVEVRRWREDDLPDDYVEKVTDVVGMIATVDLPVHRPISASMVKGIVLEGSDISLAIPQGKVGYALPLRLISTVANAVRPGDYVDVILSMSIVDVDQDSQVKQPVLLTGGEDCLAGCQVNGLQIPRLVTQYTVQRALVLGVGIWGDEKAGVTVVQLGQEEEPPIVPVAEEEGGEEAPPPEVTPVPYLKQVTVVTLAVEPWDALVLKWASESQSSIDLVLRSAVDVENFSQPEAVTLQYMIERFQISLPAKMPHVPENEFSYPLLQEAEVPAPQGE